VLLQSREHTHFAPRMLVGLQLCCNLALQASYARTFQFAQSVRNHESIAGSLFPFDLFIAAEHDSIPVARSDIGMLAAGWRTSGARVQARAWLRAAHGLVLVAPADSRPFASSHWLSGSSSARGFALDVGFSSARVGLAGSYGWQSVRHDYETGAYFPDYYGNHSAEVGVVTFPWATWSVRAAATALFGRRGTLMRGGFEWEACNLMDLGCEFAGSPDYRPDELGRLSLPAYLRVDMGIRKHWHVHVRGHSSLIAVHATLSNVLGRANVLGYALDPATNQPAAIHMIPFAPLVLGLDWQR
jgi:hypothetical protein